LLLLVAIIDIHLAVLDIHNAHGTHSELYKIFTAEMASSFDMSLIYLNSALVLYGVSFKNNILMEVLAKILQTKNPNCL